MHSEADVIPTGGEPSEKSGRGRIAILAAIVAIVATLVVWLTTSTAQSTRQLLDRSLASYNQLALVAELDAEIHQALLFATDTADTTRVEELFEALQQAGVDEQATLLASEEQETEASEEAEILQMRDRFQATVIARDGGELTAQSPNYQALLTGLREFRVEERDEVISTREQLIGLRSEVGWLAFVTTGLPLGLALLLIARIYRHQSELDGAVRARTADLAARTAELARIDRNRRLFFAKLGHELRTPLAVLLAEINIAQDGDTPQARRTWSLETLDLQGRLLSRKVTDLLALARSEDGELSLNPEPTELDTMLDKLQKLATPYAKHAGVNFSLESAVGLETELLADEYWLIHGLFAVIDNAIKASPKGGDVTLLVKDRAEAQDGALVFEVLDSGKGVVPEELPSLSKAFFRGSAETPNDGMGLGLAVVNWVATEHGGKLTMENRERGGLKVSVSVPKL